MSDVRASNLGAGDEKIEDEGRTWYPLGGVFQMGLYVRGDSEPFVIVKRKDGGVATGQAYSREHLLKMLAMLPLPPEPTTQEIRVDLLGGVTAMELAVTDEQVEQIIGRGGRMDMRKDKGSVSIGAYLPDKSVKLVDWWEVTSHRAAARMLATWDALVDRGLLPSDPQTDPTYVLSQAQTFNIMKDIPAVEEPGESHDEFPRRGRRNGSE